MSYQAYAAPLLDIITDTIWFRANSFKTGTGTSSGTCTEPAGAQAGDCLLALVLVADAQMATADPIWTDLEHFTSSTGVFGWNLCYCVRTTALTTAQLTFTWSSSAIYEVHLLDFVNVDRLQPIDANHVIGQSRSIGVSGPIRNASNINALPVTSLTARAMAVALAAHWSGSQNGWTAPTGFTYCADNTAGNRGMAGYEMTTTPGSQDPDAFFDANQAASNDIFQYILTLRAASEPDIVPRWFQPPADVIRPPNSVSISGITGIRAL